jgi:DNA-binding NarL/FixJ family response regulator
MKVLARSRAVEMRAQGMSWGKIAKELGANVETVRLAVRKALATA